MSQAPCQTSWWPGRRTRITRAAAAAPPRTAACHPAPPVSDDSFPSRAALVHASRCCRRKREAETRPLLEWKPPFYPNYIQNVSWETQHTVNGRPLEPAATGWVPGLCGLVREAEPAAPGAVYTPEPWNQWRQIRIGNLMAWVSGESQPDVRSLPPYTLTDFSWHSIGGN